MPSRGLLKARERASSRIMPCRLYLLLPVLCLIGEHHSPATLLQIAIPWTGGLRLARRYDVMIPYKGLMPSRQLQNDMKTALPS
jgi:hypothetical protein